MFCQKNRSNYVAKCPNYNRTECSAINGCKRVDFQIQGNDTCKCGCRNNETNTEFYYENYNGHANSLRNYEWGRANEPLLRISPKSEPNPRSQYNPREISNIVCVQDENTPKSILSSLVFVFGQFLDHEISITHTEENVEFITTPSDDPVLPNAQIPFKPSLKDENGEPINHISSYIDNTNVYGYSSARASALRLHDGTGKLKTGDNDLPPDNVGEHDMATNGLHLNEVFFLGDVRGNENFALIAFHTIFLREHNRLCDEYVVENPQWLGNDDKIFHEARLRLIAKVQAIVFEEFVPLLIGSKLPRYTGYKRSVNAGILNEFSSAVYRLHSIVPNEFFLGANASKGTIQLRDAFFNPQYIRDNPDIIDDLIEGAITQPMEQMDNEIVEDLRSFLFASPTSGPPPMLHDLASLNIERGRQHQLSDYNTMREAFGLKKVSSFSEITSDPVLAQKLSDAYNGNIDDIDPWIGINSEDKINGAIYGELGLAITKQQILNLQRGDRFYFENNPTLSSQEKNELKKTRLKDIIERNTNLSGVKNNVFEL